MTGQPLSDRWASGTYYRHAKGIFLRGGDCADSLEKIGKLEEEVERVGGG
jgi:hypothetical protein